MTKTIIATPDEPGDELEPRRKPFVPARDRVVYPVDYATTRQAALAKFRAEIRIEVGGQLTQRIIKRACDLEDEIRSRVYEDDQAQYASLQVVLQSFMADAIQVRHTYMNPDDKEGGR